MKKIYRNLNSEIVILILFLSLVPILGVNCTIDKPSKSEKGISQLIGSLIQFLQSPVNIDDLSYWTLENSNVALNRKLNDWSLENYFPKKGEILFINDKFKTYADFGKFTLLAREYRPFADSEVEHHKILRYTFKDTSIAFNENGRFAYFSISTNRFISYSYDAINSQRVELGWNDELVIRGVAEKREKWQLTELEFRVSKRDSAYRDDINFMFTLSAKEYNWELGKKYYFRDLLSNYYDDAPDFAAEKVVDFVKRKEISLKEKYNTNASIGIIFYSYIRPHFLIFLITSQGIVEFIQIEVKKEDLSELANELRNSIGVNALQFEQNRIAKKRNLRIVQPHGKTKNSFDEINLKVSEVLFPVSIASRLTALTHLMIVPFGEFAIIPFSSLKPLKNSLDLIDLVTISKLPCIKEITENEYYWNKNELTEFNVLAVGNPKPRADSIWYFPELPGAEREATFVAKYFNTKSYLGNEVIKEQIINKAASADMIYFATHGVVDENIIGDIDKCFLVLGGTDWKWSLREIQWTRFRAKIAVLSACQTGLGTINDAGAMSLARIFQIAGIPRIVMSLWNVDDDATELLMKDFIQNLNSNNFPASALREAQISARKKYPSNPVYWAPFEMFGTVF